MFKDKSDPFNVLESQLRECYGRVVYSHKTQEKCADILFSKNNRLQIIQIILSVLTTGSFLPIILGKDWKFSLIGAFISTLLLGINIYIKRNNIYDLAQRHRNTASSLWFVRERFLSLVTDLNMRTVDINNIRESRDNLIKELSKIYAKAPSTSNKAYKSAQKALKYNEEMTFSDEEIDAFLPKEMRRTAD